ncbi:MAG: site-specific integrase [Hyphomicrobiales bacterium]|nr:MAG: site-specific integrase [Hyphomicrobiales bacterium]
MATFRKRNGKWQVQIRRTGEHAVTRTFTLKADAAAWARSAELAAEASDVPKQGNCTYSLDDVLQRYEKEVVQGRESDSSEDFMIRVMRRDPMASKPLHLLSTTDVAAYRDARLKVSKPSSVVRHLRLLLHALKVAKQEWGWPVKLDDIRRIRMPKVAIKPVARISESEFERICEASRRLKNPALRISLELAISTCMRRGEILRLDWSDIDLGARRLLIRSAKNGHPRMVPLSPQAMTVLGSLPHREGPVVQITLVAFKLAFARARKSSGVTFRFHDLRHEAISRLFEMGLTVPEAQLVSGHRTLSQLGRYSHPDVQRIAGKLESSRW